MERSRRTHPRYIVDEAGERVSVVPDGDEHETLLQDLADLAALVARKDEETVDHEAVRARRKADGLL